ncbi:tRNA (adenosine(37)-N6)-threonylcarbamoyltransferase complex transferase subunit TsaD [Candidatus Parcubacteria bacterium]|nr:tRNA (adenosine(37)-N6)-threonylcarbamoyltransferase complex transferase subunit TsaD [Candidatus Parcubacteria bacterium]
MKILAIETSCDETAICILEATGELPEPHFKVLGNSLLSQIHIHQDYGGVYPMLAKREHIKNLPVLLEKILEEAGGMEGVDVIAVTAGPGLEPALWTGIEFAKDLGEKWKKPVLPVNHMHGHMFSFLFEPSELVKFPALALLVSGGHTEIVLMKSFKDYEIIGKTRDDAVGEAFDKVARLLDLPYPGGPKISALADMHRQKGLASEIIFPRPMINTDDFDFSYSGLKTSVLYTIKKLGVLNEEKKEEIAHAFEDAAIEVLIEKTKRALDKFGASTLIVGGGVSANRYLQERLRGLALELALDLRLPPPALTTDNAIMIGIGAYVAILNHPKILGTTREITAQGNLGI